MLIASNAATAMVQDRVATVVPQAMARARQTGGEPATYPMIARAAGVGGSVHVEAVVGIDGRVIGTRVLAGAPMLQAAAENAVRTYQFAPFERGGRPIVVRTAALPPPDRDSRELVAELLDEARDKATHKDGPTGAPAP